MLQSLKKLRNLCKIVRDLLPQLLIRAHADRHTNIYGLLINTRCRPRFSGVGSQQAGMVTQISVPEHSDVTDSLPNCRNIRLDWAVYDEAKMTSTTMAKIDRYKENSRADKKWAVGWIVPARRSTSRLLRAQHKGFRDLRDACHRLRHLTCLTNLCSDAFGDSAENSHIQPQSTACGMHRSQRRVRRSTKGRSHQALTFASPLSPALWSVHLWLRFGMAWTKELRRVLNGSTGSGGRRI